MGHYKLQPQGIEQYLAFFGAQQAISMEQARQLQLRNTGTTIYMQHIPGRRCTLYEAVNPLTKVRYWVEKKC